jgi:hypothetical protein
VAAARRACRTEARASARVEYQTAATACSRQRCRDRRSTERARAHAPAHQRFENPAQAAATGSTAAELAQNTSPIKHASPTLRAPARTRPRHEKSTEQRWSNPHISISCHLAPHSWPLAELRVQGTCHLRRWAWRGALSPTQTLRVPTISAAALAGCRQVARRRTTRGARRRPDRSIAAGRASSRRCFRAGMRRRARRSARRRPER